MNELIQTKKCEGHCKIEKRLTQFKKNKLRGDGRDSHCRACKKAYKAANKERDGAYKDSSLGGSPFDLDKWLYDSKPRIIND